MSRAKRGGLTLKTGKIGRVNVLRQNIMMPGERINMNISGKCRLEALRERDVMRINAHLATFMTPLRWVWPEFPDYVKEGPNTAITPPLSATRNDWSALGIGSYFAGTTNQHYKWYTDVPLRIYNEWYKWPEKADITSWPDQGGVAVPLAKAWSRVRQTATPDDTSEYTIDVSTPTMDVRELAEVQGRFRSAMKRDVLSYNRWMELVKETWRGDGSREVDQVPIMLDQVEVGVNPREVPAVDGASLGQWQSLFDFGINHRINGIVAPEHCIITTILTVRFASVIDGCMPLANSNTSEWETLVADPETMTVQQPELIGSQHIHQTNLVQNLGYLPKGWAWRCDHDVIGKAVDIRDSFPYMTFPQTFDQTKDATRVKSAFRSQALDDYLVDVYFKEDSVQPIGDSMDSYMAGMMDHTQPRTGGRNEEFPAGGKML